MAVESFLTRLFLTLKQMDAKVFNRSRLVLQEEAWDVHDIQGVEVLLDPRICFQAMFGSKFDNL